MRRQSERAPLNALVTRAAEAFAARRFADAADAFEEATRFVPNDVALWCNLGNARLSAKDVRGAIEAYERAVTIDERNGAVWYNFGAALLAADDPATAADAYARAIACGLATYEAFVQLGVATKRDGRLHEAERAYRRALELSPNDVAAHVNLGNALGDAGRHDEAIAAYEAALAIDPSCATAWFDLFAAVHDDDPIRAGNCLRSAIAADPRHAGARFHLGALAALRGDDDEARAWLDDAPAHLRSSLDFALAHRAPIFTDGFRLLDHALAASPREGMVHEFGVRHGTSIGHIASRVGAQQTVHGFDSFEGLPTAWGALPKGAYSTRGRLPEVPSNVVLHRGWFAETLAPFVHAHDEPVRFMNVDCDLYASTREVLDAFGPRLVAGSVVVFDEYLCNPGWEEEEHRALVEASRAFGFSYEYLAFSLFSRQAAIRVR